MNERDSFLDNAKGVLIILVFFGHCMEFINGWQDDFARFILTAIYLIHMPAFCFLAGVTTSAEKAKDRFIDLMFLFIIFQFIYTPFIWLADWPLYEVFVKPIYTLWFLLSLAIWTLFLPLFLKIKNQLSLFFAISLLTGGLSFVGYTLGISRTVYFLIFFIAGNLYGKPAIAAIKQCSDVRTRFIAMLLIVCFTTFIYFLNIKHTIFYGVSSYAKVGYGFFEGAGLRATIYLISVVLMFAFMVMVGSGKGIITRIGRNSLSIFIIHPLLLLLFLGDWLQKLNNHIGHEFSVVVIALITTGISAMLSRDAITYHLSKPAIYMANRFRRSIS